MCAGTTGHAEVVQVQFDTRVVNYEQLLKVGGGQQHQATLIHCSTAHEYMITAWHMLGHRAGLDIILQSVMVHLAPCACLSMLL